MESNNCPACTCACHTIPLALLSIFSAPGKPSQIPEEWGQYINLLEEPYQTALRDHDLRHLSYGILARKYGCSCGTIKSLVWRGRRLLIILIAQQHVLSSPAKTIL